MILSRRAASLIRAPTPANDPRLAGALLDRLTRTTADQWAVSALSVAIDDLRARQLGVSVADLYGGRRRDAVRAYASTAGYHAVREPEELWPAEAALAVVIAMPAAYRPRPGTAADRKSSPQVSFRRK